MKWLRVNSLELERAQCKMEYYYVHPTCMYVSIVPRHCYSCSYEITVNGIV